MWRHGDVFIQECGKLPRGAKHLPHLILARGEATGHAHRIRERQDNDLYQHGESLYLKVGESATVVHEEHGPIPLDQGVYRVWIQREYSPQEIRRVVD